MGKDLMDLHSNYETVEEYRLVCRNTHEGSVKRPNDEPNTLTDLRVSSPKPKLKADKETGIIYLNSNTSLEGVPAIAWEYKLGNRSALEWVLDQYKEKKPKDKAIAEKFNTYRFAGYKEHVIELLQRVCTGSVKTMEIVKKMEN